jgi:para-nitrobenzyl esterase
MSSIDRRTFVGFGALATAGVFVESALSTACAPSTTAVGSSGAIVQTTAGQVRGLVQDKVHTFKGVPYGASTADAGRFMPPAKPQPWNSPRDAFTLGPRAPQIFGGEPAEVAATDPREALGEDCLCLNVWTPSPSDGRRRPVMVWLHGGGYTSGSGSYSMYDGKELARKHDVVAISVNHRLNVFGFLYLAEIGGAKYANASNVGMLDIVAALEWVRDNIAAFGGDPANVTIFGQSGGAGKVSTLMAMPSAKGLFHRAIAQSGSNVRGLTRSDANKTAETVLSKLGLTTSQVDDLQTMPMERLLSVMRGPGPGAPGALTLGPVVDGRTLPSSPFEPSAPALSNDIPLLTGTTATEVTFFSNTQLDPIDDATFRMRVKELLKVNDAKADKVIAVYRKNRPTSNNIDLFLRMSTDAGFFPQGVDTQASRKAAAGKAPVYVYRFEWYSPVREGKLKAYHTLEIPFVFDNVDGSPTMTGVGKERYALADRMSAAWVAFARTGNPKHPGLPDWPPFNADQRPTMVFDNDCKLVNDPGGEERASLMAARDTA